MFSPDCDHKIATAHLKLRSRKLAYQDGRDYAIVGLLPLDPTFGFSHDSENLPVSHYFAFTTLTQLPIYSGNGSGAQKWACEIDYAFC